MRYMRRLLPGATIDERRFRPNILVADDSDESGPAELNWIGRGILIGGAACHVQMGCTRCIMVIREQPGLERRPEIMRVLVRELSQKLSVYAHVKREGLVSIGDAVCTERATASDR